EIVAHEEAAAQQVFAQLLSLSLSQLPMTHLDCVEPWPIEDVVSIIEVDGLLHGPDMDSRQTSQCAQEVPVGPRVILCPNRKPMRPIGSPEAARTAKTRAPHRRRWIHEP